MDFGSSVTKKSTGPTKKWTEKMIKDELKKFDEKIAEAKEREGDVEVRDNILDEALFLKNEARDFPEAEKVF